MEKRERKKERDGIERKRMFIKMDVKLYFLVQYIQYQVKKENFFGYVLDI